MKENGIFEEQQTAAGGKLLERSGDREADTVDNRELPEK